MMTQLKENFLSASGLLLDCRDRLVVIGIIQQMPWNWLLEFLKSLLDEILLRAKYSTLAKLGMFERMVEEGEDLSPPPDILYPWTGPEILLGHNVALAEGDVYSLCCLLWEMVKMKVPWARHRSQDIPVLVARGYTLKLARDTMPRLLFRVMREGLIWNVDMRDLELGEVRDMLLMERDIQEQRMEEADASVQDRVAKVSARKQVVKPPKKEDSKTNVVRPKSSALRRFSNTAIQSDIVKYVKRREEDVFEDDNYSGVDLPSVSEGLLEDDLESSLCSVEICEGPKNPKTCLRNPWMFP